MGEKIKIKVVIADRVYPLTIDGAQEEGVRRAGKVVNEMITVCERDYAVRDKQDAVAMVAFQLASKMELGEIQSKNEDLELLRRLEALCDSMSKSNQT